MKEKKSSQQKMRKFGAENLVRKTIVLTPLHPRKKFPLKPHTWLGPILNLGSLVIKLNPSMVVYTCPQFKLLCLVLKLINTQYRRLA
jgi:hypothetical protein